MEDPLWICTEEEIRGVIRFLSAEGVNLRKLFVEFRLKTVAIVYRTVKFTLYAMRRDQMAVSIKDWEQ
jgi:hypothetical protein